MYRGGEFLFFSIRIFEDTSERSIQDPNALIRCGLLGIAFAVENRIRISRRYSIALCVRSGSAFLVFGFAGRVRRGNADIVGIAQPALAGLMMGGRWRRGTASFDVVATHFLAEGRAMQSEMARGGRTVHRVEFEHALEQR